MQLWEYLLLLFTVLLGGFAALLVNPKDPSRLPLFLSFSGAYILGICVMDIMPTVFRSSVENVGIYILIGFFIQLILEQFSGGVEHGHIHVPHHQHQVRRHTTMVMIGLCLHAFIEGLPLGGHVHDHSGHHLLWSIVLHKAPAAFALVLLLKKSGYQKKVWWTLLIIFALMSPLAAALTAAFAAQDQITDWHINVLQAVVIGSFLHIATTILFESDSSRDHHAVPLPKLIAILVGVGIAVLSVIL